MLQIPRMSSIKLRLKAVKKDEMDEKSNTNFKERNEDVQIQVNEREKVTHLLR